MKFTVASVAAVCAAVVIAVSGGTTALAKNGQDKRGPDQMGKMDMHDQSITGCVEAGKTPRTFVLTHVAAADDHMAKDAMAKDSMSKDSMSKDSMGMSKGEMGPTPLVISSKAVDLSKHVGQKVTVSGTAPKADGMGKDSMGMATDGPAFTIKTLKVLGSSCQ